MRTTAGVLWVLACAVGCTAEDDLTGQGLIPVPEIDAAVDAAPDVAAPDRGMDPAPDGAMADMGRARIAPEPTPAPATILPNAPRIIAIGDVHGDLLAARAALETAGVVDDNGQWIGDDTVVVQVGDQTDRGDEERAILDWFEALRAQATAVGGAFHPLIGNHEMMNVQLDLRYVTDGGFADFDDVPGEPPAELGPIDPAFRGRVMAFRPGGPYARVIAGHNAVLVVGETLFVHGGVLPAHIDYGLERLNREMQDWMRGDAPEPLEVTGGLGPLWDRTFSDAPGPDECDLLTRVLAGVPVKRMVVAHTVQDTINAACDGRVWRVDVGLAAYYGGPTEALEIRGDDVRVLR